MQCDDRKQGNRKYMRIDNKSKVAPLVLDALCREYFTGIIVDVEKDQYEVLHFSPWMEKYPKEGKFSEFIDEYVKDFITEEFQQEFRKALSKSMLCKYLESAQEENEERSYYVEYASVRYEKPCWCKCKVHPLRGEENETGKAQHVLVLLQDITERKNYETEYQEKLKAAKKQAEAAQKRAEEARYVAEEAQRLAEKAKEEADRANEAKTNFLRRMSHDIRTPINGIRGLVRMSDYYGNDPERMKDCRAKVLTATDHLLSLVNDVLDMGKLESGKFILKHDPFTLSRVLKEVNMVSESQAEDCNIRFISQDIREIEHDHVIGSPVYLKRIFLNFISNAIKYNREGGSVYVHGREVSFDGKTALYEFVCEDTGIGMSEEFQKYAFEPFTQEEKDDARTIYAGTGLGLSITKQLIDLMGGEIKLESKEGVGTKVIFRIPLEVDLEERSEKTEIDYSKVMFDGVRVLLVEDNGLNAEIASFLLERHGMEVTWVQNGKKAVDEMTRNPDAYDVIFMDIMMPIMDGLKATETIRRMGNTIPILAMTANAFTDDMQKSLAVGMDAHLTKPLHEKAIVKAITKYVK